MSTLNFAPGESNVSHETFSPSVVLFWLRTEIGVSNSRIVTKVPNTILGVIPLGSADGAYPISNVASVGVDAKFSIFRLIFGFFWFSVGLAAIADVPIVGLPLFLLGVSLLANTMSASLSIVNNGGGTTTIDVSILEKSKLQQFREKINEQVFANHGALRHAETMQVQNQQLQVQQQQLNAQIMQQQHQLGQYQPQHLVQQQQQPPPASES